MIIGDIANLIKNGFSHDEIMDILRGKAPESGTPSAEPVAENKMEVDPAIEELKQEYAALKERYATLENRINTDAVKASENEPPVPEAPSMEKIMEDIIKNQ